MMGGRREFRGKKGSFDTNCKLFCYMSRWNMAITYITFPSTCTENCLN